MDSKRQKADWEISKKDIIFRRQARRKRRSRSRLGQNHATHRDPQRRGRTKELNQKSDASLHIQLKTEKVDNQQEQNIQTSRRITNSVSTLNAFIYHERQVKKLCGLHTINNVLQGLFFTEEDLRKIARRLDNEERAIMGDPLIPDDIVTYSHNMDQTGNFSIQVITVALASRQLEVIPILSEDPRAIAAVENSWDQSAFICNFHNHWYAVRKIGSEWYDLNSCFEEPRKLKQVGTKVSCFTEEKLEKFEGLFVVVPQIAPQT